MGICFFLLSLQNECLERIVGVAVSYHKHSEELEDRNNEICQCDVLFPLDSLLYLFCPKGMEEKVVAGMRVLP